MSHNCLFMTYKRQSTKYGVKQAMASNHINVKVRFDKFNDKYAKVENFFSSIVTAQCVIMCYRKTWIFSSYNKSIL